MQMMIIGGCTCWLGHTKGCQGVRSTGGILQRKLESSRGGEHWVWGAHGSTVGRKQPALARHISTAIEQVLQVWMGQHFYLSWLSLCTMSGVNILLFSCNIGYLHRVMAQTAVWFCTPVLSVTNVKECVPRYSTILSCYMYCQSKLCSCNWLGSCCCDRGAGTGKVPPVEQCGESW